MSLLDARRVTDLDGSFQPAGDYRFLLHLDSGEPPTAGAATLKTGDLTIVGRVLDGRGGADAPAYPAVVFAGGAGWRTKLPKGSYASPSGVRLSTVLSDLGRLCGESYDAPAEVRLGPAYGWEAGARGRVVLADLVARGAVPTWRVEPTTGRTVFSAWPARGAADAFGTVTSRDLARGVRHVALIDTVSAWLPGATVQGTMIKRLILHEADGALRAEAWDA